MAESRQLDPAPTSMMDPMTRVRRITFELWPIDPSDADRLRASWAHASVYVADEHPGYPCRQCLKDAEIGEELLLVSYDPFVTDSPYRSASPIFLHRVPCAPPADRRTLPQQLTTRLLSVRSFDAKALMIDAAVVAGRELADTLNQLLANEDCDHVHVHNASRGCWAVRVERATSRSAHTRSDALGTSGVPRPIHAGPPISTASPSADTGSNEHRTATPNRFR
jgi:Protein of unknown function (DUF1203)